MLMKKVFTITASPHSVDSHDEVSLEISKKQCWNLDEFWNRKAGIERWIRACEMLDPVLYRIM